MNTDETEGTTADQQILRTGRFTMKLLREKCLSKASVKGSTDPRASCWSGQTDAALIQAILGNVRGNQTPEILSQNLCINYRNLAAWYRRLEQNWNTVPKNLLEHNILWAIQQAQAELHPAAEPPVQKKLKRHRLSNHLGSRSQLSPRSARPHPGEEVEARWALRRPRRDPPTDLRQLAQPLRLASRFIYLEHNVTQSTIKVYE